MDVAKHILQPLIIAIVIGAVAGLARRSQGAQRSRNYAFVVAVGGAIFLIIGFIALLTRGLEHVTAHAVFGILFMLFGVTCLFQTHTHLEIARLKKQLEAKQGGNDAQQ